MALHSPSGEKTFWPFSAQHGAASCGYARPRRARRGTQWRWCGSAVGFGSITRFGGKTLFLAQRVCARQAGVRQRVAGPGQAKPGSAPLDMSGHYHPRKRAEFWLGHSGHRVPRLGSSRIGAAPQAAALLDTPRHGNITPETGKTFGWAMYGQHGSGSAPLGAASCAKSGQYHSREGADFQGSSRRVRTSQALMRFGPASLPHPRKGKDFRDSPCRGRASQGRARRYQGRKTQEFQVSPCHVRASRRKRLARRATARQLTPEQSGRFYE